MTILTIGIKDKNEAMKELPVRLIVMDDTKNAIRCLKEEKIDSLIGHWDIVGLDDGIFLRKVIAARPFMSTIAFVRSGNIQQELAARNLGVTAVLSDDTDSETFKQFISRILGLDISDDAFIKVFDDSYYTDSLVSDYYDDY